MAGNASSIGAGPRAVSACQHRWNCAGTRTASGSAERPTAPPHLTDSEAVKVETLKKRAEFLRTRGGSRWSNSAFVIEAKVRPQPVDSNVGRTTGPRFGFTVTKKIGNAVVRNRIRRRLKEAAGSAASEYANPNFDYVIIARKPSIDMQFEALCRAIAKGLQSTSKDHRQASRNTSTLEVIDGNKQRDEVPLSLSQKKRQTGGRHKN